jgi:hypothetical protein
MRKIISGMVVITGLAASGAFALGTAARADDSTTTNQSETTTHDNGPGSLTSSKLDFEPMAGALVYKDALGSTTSRGIVGLGLSSNMLSIAMGSSPVYLGPDTGLFFAHQGSASSDFIGTDPSAAVNSAGANLFLIPANLKLAVNLADFLQIGAHGGGNVIYRSDLGATQLSSNEGTVGTHWGLYPNVGADVNFQFVRGVTISFRPDWTLTTGNNLFSGMVGLNFNLG